MPPRRPHMVAHQQVVLHPPGGKLSVASLHNVLGRLFGIPKPGPLRSPLESLVLTILSQNTNDRNRDRAYAALRSRFPTWETVARARPREIAAAIRPGGLANVKGRRILEILSDLKARFGGYDLNFLCRLPPEEAASLLGKFPGVGPKTVNCVLLFGCGHPVFPVDTHILRVTKRVGYIAANVSLEKAHRLLADVVPPELRYALHLNLIHFGREICHAQRPKCAVCPLRRHCFYYAALTASSGLAASPDSYRASRE